MVTQYDSPDVIFTLLMIMNEFYTQTCEQILYILILMGYICQEYISHMFFLE